MPRPKRMALCHPDKKHRAHNLCESCYAAARHDIYITEYADKARRWAAKVKLEAFDAYGGRICACCEETTIQFLSIDHVNNDGNTHQTTKSRRGVRYHQLRKLGWPNNPPLQVLCMNCNWGKRINGGICPHKMENLNSLKSAGKMHG